jgi:hypothetical protein
VRELKDYKALRHVPIEHPSVKCKCVKPEIICPDACGNNGCLAIEHRIGDCMYMQAKNK